jgi:hypothetical protein
MRGVALADASRRIERGEKGSRPTMKGLFKTVVLAIILILVSGIAHAQLRIHALSGTVTAINPKIQMTEVTPDDGSSPHFQWIQKSDGDIAFDKSVSNDAVAADKFTTKDTHVIAYYFGDGEKRTIVALHDLGNGPLLSSSGTVVKFNKHDHLLTITNSKGGEENYRTDAKTVGDTENGVSTNNKFDFAKGIHVRVIAAQTGDSQTALLIVPII